MIGRAFALSLALPVMAVAAPAAASELPLRDYVHTAWTQHDGVPLGRVEQILQTEDGYLWVITRDEGLLRFDGMRFVPAITPCRQPVTHAASAPDGGFWAICGYQLVRRAANGQFLDIPQTFLRPRPPPVPWLIVARAGLPWFLRGAVRYLESDGTGGREMPRPTAGDIRTATVDADGTIWVSDTEQVVHVYADHTQATALSPVWCLVAAA